MKNVQIFVLALAMVLVSGLAWAWPPSDNAEIVSNSQGSVELSAGWCEDVTNLTENLWLSANVPSTVTATEAWQVRYVKVYHADATDATEPVCIRLGGVFPQAALTCTSTTTDGEYLFGFQSGTQFQVRHPRTSTSIVNMLPTLLVRAQNAATVRLCVAIYW